MTSQGAVDNNVANLVADLPVIARGDVWTLYRDAAVMLVRFHGDLDDDASSAWREQAQQSVAALGWPRFAVVAPTEGTASTTLQSRMRTAAYLRLAAQNVERVAILSSRTTTFVIRTVLRAAGAANVELVDVAEAAAHLAKLRASAPR